MGVETQRDRDTASTGDRVVLGDRDRRAAVRPAPLPDRAVALGVPLRSGVRPRRTVLEHHSQYWRSLRTERNHPHGDTAPRGRVGANVSLFDGTDYDVVAR